MFGKIFPTLLKRPVENYNSLLFIKSFNFYKFIIIAFFLGCQSDPISYNIPGGYSYEKKIFHIDNTNSFSTQDDLHTGESFILYSGIVALSDDTQDTTALLIHLFPELISDHDICNNPDSISKVDIILTSITQLKNEDNSLTIDRDALKIYFLSNNHVSSNWEENQIISSSDIMTTMNELDSYIVIDDSFIDIGGNSISINLHNYNTSIIEDWCGNIVDYYSGIIISYVPLLSNLSDEPKYIEIVSSDIITYPTLKPMLNLEYQRDSIVTIYKNRYSLSEIISLNENLVQPYYIKNSLLNDSWGKIYAVNIENNPSSELDNVIDMESVLIMEDIVSEEQLGSEISLLNIVVEITPEILDSITEISFSLKNPVAYVSTVDISGDNYDILGNPNGTEGNMTWDVGEVLTDYGSDGCTDKFESGDPNIPCLATENLSYPGTEGNGYFDDGEELLDYGIDGCPDNREAGLDENNNPTCLDESSVDNTEIDPNKDNYNMDPNDDNYSLNNISGTENNGIWDTNEFFFDWGSDGLPQEIMGYIDSDGSEGNAEWNQGEEWLDHGIDGCADQFESGNFNVPCLDAENLNYPGTEGNGEFDGIGEFLDCGIDNICNGEVGDNNLDDYNIDPNDDNYNAETNSVGTENNNQWDQGEEWLDDGIDTTPDSLEVFQESFTISPQLYEDIYTIDLTGSVDTVFANPTLVSDTVSIWISEINRNNDNSLALQVKIQSNIALQALEFQLNHIKYAISDTVFRTHTSLLSSSQNNKLFKDFTLFPRQEYGPKNDFTSCGLDNEKESVCLDTTLQVNYTNHISASLNFEGLDSFIEGNEYIFSEEYTNLILYIDTTNSYIDEDGMLLFLGYEDDFSQNIIFENQPILVYSHTDSIVIPISQFMTSFQNDRSDKSIKILTNSSRYNYSTLKILFNDMQQVAKNPRLDIMYTE